MSETWLTSDIHLGHERVANIRGFSSHVEADAHIARRWDRRVSEGDTVFVLGDIAMNGWSDRLEWFGERPGVKHLILGNHDRAHPGHSNAHAHVRRYLEFFESVGSAGSLRSGKVLLSHFPYDGEGATREDGKRERYAQWRLRDEGLRLLHGHTHDTVRFRLSAAGSPMVHVGLDAWDLAPVTLHDALAEIPGAARAG